MDAEKHETIISGRGLTQASALVRCRGEAMEFLSLCWSGKVLPAEAQTVQAVQPGKIPEVDISLFSFLGQSKHAFELVPVTPLNGGSASCIPSALIYRGHPDGARISTFALPDSNGAAAGRTRASAIRAALFELIERDAVAIWWYNRLQRPAADRAARDHLAIYRLAIDLAIHSRLLLLLDLTHDLGVPVMAAISAKMDGSEIVIGTAAAATPREAVIGAAGELVQILAGIAGPIPDGELDEREARALRWLKGATLRDTPYLIPSKTAPPPPKTARMNVRQILKKLANCGVHVYMHDATRPEIGVPVVKLFAPGLRHTRPRFEPGRLFDVPVALGWRSEPILPAQLNPWPWPY